MKLQNLLALGSVLALGTSCVYSHRHAAVYSATPNGVIVAPTPASDQPAVRVYSPPSGTRPIVVEPTAPGNASATDLAIAEKIRQMFDADPSLAGRATNMKALVQGGRVTLEGTVPTRGDKKQLERRISTIPDVVEVNDRLDVGVPGR